MPPAENELLATLQRIAAVVATHVHAYAPDVASMFSHYATNRSEFQDTSAEAMTKFCASIISSIEVVYKSSPYDAATLFGEVFGELTPEDHMPFALMLANAVHPSFLTKMTPYIAHDSNARYAFSAMMLGIASEGKMDVTQVQHLAKLACISVDEVLATEQFKHKMLEQQLNQYLQMAGFPVLDVGDSGPSLHYAVAQTLFGTPWATLYATEPLTVTSLIQEVLLQRPPFCHDKQHGGCLPDSYTV